MTNSEQAIREFVDKWGMGYFDDGVDYGYKPTSKKIEECRSDLIALISEHYVSREEYDKLRKVMDRLIEWHNEYPPERVYSYSEAPTIEHKLTAIIDAAEAAIKNTETK